MAKAKMSVRSYWDDYNVDADFRREDGTPLWEQYPGEPSIAYTAFLAFRDLGPVYRTFQQARMIALGWIAEEHARLKKLDCKNGVKMKRDLDKALRRSVMVKYEWVRRAQAWDVYRGKVLGQKVQRSASKKKEDALMQIEGVRERILARLMTMPIEKIHPSEGMSMFESLQRMERTLEGQPGEIHGLHTDQAVSLEGLSTEELVVFADLLAKATGSRKAS